ncbi:MAG: cation transporter [Clostridia bacterium]|nr:cation transporter [Clostridia bacterium]
MTTKQSALAVSAVNGLLNIALAVTKLIVGAWCASQALVSDGVHGLADVVSAVVVIVGIRLSAKESNDDYPYGRDRAECVAALLLAVLIGLTGAMLGVTGIRGVFAPTERVSALGGVALWTAMAAVILKEGMFRVTRRAARKTGSTALMADAWHQRADVLSSLGGFLGVCGTQLGWQAADPLASVLISACILKTAVTIFADAVRRMTDHAADPQKAEILRGCLAEMAGVVAVESLKTRLFGSRWYAEVTIAVDDGCGSKEAYAIAQTVRQTVQTAFDDLKECAVHIHPIAVAKSSES